MSRNIYEVKVPGMIRENACAEAVVPGSKSITNRALLIAAMADGVSTLNGCLSSDDAAYFLECIRTLGFPVEEEDDGALGKNIRITGFGGSIPNKSAEIYVGSAGTAARFLVAMLAFSDGVYTINSSEQMKKRPMQPLIDTLRSAGAGVECLEEEGHFPLRITGIGSKELIPSEFTVNIDKSSQFLSALLIAAGTFGKNTTIHVSGSHGLSYVDLTAEMMRHFGVSAEKVILDGKVGYRLSGEEFYTARDYDIEPDMSAAAYFYALAAILGVTIRVKGVTEKMLQGDTQFIGVLEKIGCRREVAEDGVIALTGPVGGNLAGGFEVDMSSFSDQALTLAAIAPFADAPVEITGISHIRLQECDRIAAIIENLASLGIRTDELEDGVRIYPGEPDACDIETYDDHRVAMSFALTGLRSQGVRILDPQCCRKTFAEYFTQLEKVLNDLS